MQELSMARPQSGIAPTPLYHNRIQVFEILDLPMTSMTVGQFSVMIPGLGHQLAQSHSGEEMRVTVGFGFMFWTLAWHGMTPRHFQPFETLESDDIEICEGEGDLWVHYTSTSQSLINELNQKVDNNLKGLIRVVEDHDLLWEKQVDPDLKAPEGIWIPNDEAEFSRGTFMLHLEMEHQPLFSKPLIQSFHALLEEQEMADRVMIRSMDINEEEKKGTHLQLFHQNSGKLDSFLEDWLEQDQFHLLGIEGGEFSAQANRFFIPSLDVLTGLRQGGIRMNRFSQTRQWKE